ncbi:MAG: peptide chain release factor N(5)-glutamine methyltransferase [bacterium]|nr:peptide chain release factor N(5)-glutamine methyltransferase [bacterium]
MTIKDLLSWGTSELQSISPDEASRDAEYLLAHVLKTSREYILAHPDRALRGDDTAEYKTLVDQRRMGNSLSLLTKQAWFYALPFIVSPQVLTPRPETELLIALATARQKKESPVMIVDVGTGSGCIAIALAKTLIDAPPIYAIDISPEALLVAKRNAEENRVDHQINFLSGNLLEPLTHDIRMMSGHKWIIGNLPYLPKRIYNANPDLRNEPRIALLGGEDGLDCIRSLLAMMHALTPPWTLFMEIDPSINDALVELLQYHFPGKTPAIICDLHGHERVCIVNRET